MAAKKLDAVYSESISMQDGHNRQLKKRNKCKETGPQQNWSSSEGFPQ